MSNPDNYIDVEEQEAVTIIQNMVRENYTIFGLSIMIIHVALERYYEKYQLRHRGPNPLQQQMDFINRLVHRSDVICHEQLRMDMRCFMCFCHLLTRVGLSNSRHVLLKEKVAMFLYVIGHDHKNRVVKNNFIRSGQTVSRHFNAVLNGVMDLHGELLKAPEPVTLSNADDRWRFFQVTM